MNLPASLRIPLVSDSDRGRRHRLWLRLAALAAVVLIVTLILYGFDYYTLNPADRVFSPKHSHLKPSGTVGARLGLLGFLCFLLIYLYPIRKRWSWLAKKGNSKYWLNFHVLLGLTAPVIISFHSSFKFQGIAGMAYWSMVVVALSGVVGRYIYAQIPRNMNAIELSLKETEAVRERLSQQLNTQHVLSARDLAPLFTLPSRDKVRSIPLAYGFLRMVTLDLRRPILVWRVRRRALRASGVLITLGGILPSPDNQLERTIAIAKRQASLSKKIFFLSEAQRIFQFWHVVHRPFSYSFAVLACIHILIVLLLGYF